MKDKDTLLLEQIYLEMFYFTTSCVTADGDDINDMKDSADEVDFEDFMENVSMDQLLLSGPPQMYSWTDDELSDVQNRELVEEIKSSSSDLRFEDDWSVRFFKGEYQGKPCYYYVHSGIEYIFIHEDYI